MDSGRQVTMLRRPITSTVFVRNDDIGAIIKTNLSELADASWNHVVGDEVRAANICHAIHQQGCFEELASWLRNTADILFVLGYCVISFLKLSFLGILRYEIKEMIQKIKLLQQELNGGWLNGDDGDQNENYQTVITHTEIQLFRTRLYQRSVYSRQILIKVLIVNVGFITGFTR